MRKPKEHSIAQKLTWMNMLVSGIALLIACSAFIGYDVVSFRKATLRSLSTQAQIIGTNTVSALVFDDPDSAEKTLAALADDPNIVTAVIYGHDGQPFASYSRAHAKPIPPLPQIPSGHTEASWITDNSVDLARTIDFGGQSTSTVYLRYDILPLRRRLQLFIGIAFIVLVLSLLAALLVSAVFRRLVARPIVRLAEVAKTISRDRSYSIRAAELRGEGEITVLIDAFNEMMAQIEAGEQGLQQARDQLEKRVEERTAELVESKKKVEAYSESVLRAKEDIERASKFKDQFLSTMSHELRTPLNAVLGFSELLADPRYGELSERQQRYVHHIHTSGQHLLQLINDILDLSKIEAGRLQLSLENVTVATRLAEVADALRPLVDKKSQTLTLQASKDLIVSADPTRFNQMLMNLLGNAIKFTPEGGQIGMAALRVGNSIRVEVRDSGPGIPPEEEKRIFEAFHRIKQANKSVEGTGLGLAITRSLAELHGGQLGLETELGAGSCFYFTLPAVAVPPRQEAPDGPADTAAISRARILVVDDDVAAGFLLESQLTSAGYDVILCNNPERAVEQACELMPTAITLDIVMRPVNGWQVLSQLKSDSRTAHIPVIIASVVDQPQRGALLGADEYIVKPIDQTILLRSIKRCLQRTVQPQNGSSILVVEDDPSTREFVADLLSREGYIVSTAADAMQAREMIHSQLPRMVLLDLMLPDVNGFHLIAEWRQDERTADLPIFVMTNKDLTPQERDYLHVNTEALFNKHEQWREALMKHVERIMQPAISGAV